MAKAKRKRRGVAAAYAALNRRLRGAEPSPEEAHAAASELRGFGRECDRFINRKLKTAPPGELKLLLSLARHLEDAQVGEGLEEVLLRRTVPLALKLECFEVMAETGHAVDEAFLKQLQEIEEILVQLGSLLSAGDEESLLRGLALADDFNAMPAALKLPFLRELWEQCGHGALPFLVRVAGRDGETDQLIIDLISEEESEEAVAALRGIAERGSGGDKETIKRARRALYRLRERGMVLAVEEERADISVAADELGEQAYSTAIDTFGGRLLVLAVPSLVDILVCHGGVDDSGGLLDFTAAEMSRGQFRKHLKGLREEIEASGGGDRTSTLYQIDPDRCRWLLEEAYILSLEVGALIPEQYKALRYRLRPPDGYDPAAALGRSMQVGEDDVRSVSSRVEEIFSVPEVGIWMVDRETLLPFVNRFLELADSKLVLDEQQRRQRLDDALAEFTSEYFDGGRLARMSRRLQETAYLLSLGGEREGRAGRMDEAVRLAALAADITGSSFLKPHPFLVAFMTRSVLGIIHALRKEEGEEGLQPHGEDGPADGGRIIRPDRL